MKTILTVASILLMTVSAYAQNFEKLFYKDLVKETNEFTLTIDNAVSTVAETKFKFKVTNKTNDYIIYKPVESKFIINGNEGRRRKRKSKMGQNGRRKSYGYAKSTHVYCLECYIY